MSNRGAHPAVIYDSESGEQVQSIL